VVVSKVNLASEVSLRARDSTKGVKGRWAMGDTTNAEVTAAEAVGDDGSFTRPPLWCCDSKFGLLLNVLAFYAYKGNGKYLTIYNLGRIGFVHVEL
jgi:hypothetical protein